jgi:hypothetical protein
MVAAPDEFRVRTAVVAKRKAWLIEQSGDEFAGASLASDYEGESKCPELTPAMSGS